METTIDEPESDTVPGLAGQNSELENISSPRGKNSLERDCAVCVLSRFSRV